MLAAAAILRIGLIGCMMLVLSACGWHVRGTAPGGASLEGVEIAVHSPAGLGQLYREVRTALETAGAQLVEPRAGVPTVVLFRERQATRNISGGRRAEVQEYELRYEVDWELRDGEGEPLIERTAFQQFRNYRFERAQVLGSERREDALVAELQRDAAMLLSNRVQSVLGERAE
ncbi:MAG: LPS assembly lipoprotein LptE [Aquisalimonadaceae bacterium]